MTYFHIDRAQRYIQGLGFGTGAAQGINKRTQVAVANAFRDDNSYYSPADPPDQVRQRGRRRRRGRRRDPARIRPRDAGRPGPRVRAGQPGGGDRRGLRRLLGRRDVVPVTGHERQGRRLHLRLGRRQLGKLRPLRSTAGAAGARTATTPCPRPRPTVRSAASTVWARSGRAPCGTCGARSAARAFDRILLSSQFMYTPNERFDEAVEALIAADQASTGGANQDLICAEMERQRGIEVGDCP